MVYSIVVIGVIPCTNKAVLLRTIQPRVGVGDTFRFRGSIGHFDSTGLTTSSIHLAYLPVFSLQTLGIGR